MQLTYEPKVQLGFFPHDKYVALVQLNRVRVKKCNTELNVTRLRKVTVTESTLVEWGFRYYRTFSFQLTLEEERAQGSEN